MREKREQNNKLYTTQGIRVREKRGQSVCERKEKESVFLVLILLGFSSSPSSRDLARLLVVLIIDIVKDCCCCPVDVGTYCRTT